MQFVLGQSRGVRERLANILGFEVWQIVDDLPCAHSVRDKIHDVRNTWQFYRDRRPDAYGDLVRP